MTEKGMRDPQRAEDWRKWAATAAVAGLVLAVGGASLLANIAERRAEAATPFFRVVELNDYIDDPEVWGKNFPRQYNAFMRTQEMVPTKHGGSYKVERAPTEDDPRTFTAGSKLEKDPRRMRMWAGMPFAVDFRQARGHYWNFIDQKYTKRQTQFNQPGTCLQCHASSYVGMLTLGEGDVMKGFEVMNQMPWAEAAVHANKAVACVDCHSPETMELRVTRPALMEGMQAWKASQGIHDYDVNRDASRQEMRSLVCAQCHVEYYFQGPERRLVFPWHKGLEAENMMAVLNERGFNDWTHGETGAGMLKVQHPEYELFMQGVHARAGVACADCHMPMKREGGMKISDHHVRSPLLNVNGSCQTCHRATQEELVERVHQIQDRHMEMQDRALNALMALIDDLSRVRNAEGETARVKEAQRLHRQASWYIDFVDAENSTGFHAPQEAARLLTKAIDYSRQGQLVLSGGTLRPEAVQASKPAPEPAGQVQALRAGFMNR
jgi:nitrite reductase (cytochrome c-552)